MCVCVCEVGLEAVVCRFILSSYVRLSFDLFLRTIVWFGVTPSYLFFTGYDPHDDSDFLTIHDNVVYDNFWHGIIASKRCNNVSIQVCMSL